MEQAEKSGKHTKDLEGNVAILALLLACGLLASGCASTPRQAKLQMTQRIDTPMQLIEATAELAETSATCLHPNYIWAALKDREEDAELNAAFEQTLADGRLRCRRASVWRTATSGFAGDKGIHMVYLQASGVVNRARQEPNMTIPLTNAFSPFL